MSFDRWRCQNIISPRLPRNYIPSLAFSSSILPGENTSHKAFAEDSVPLKGAKNKDRKGKERKKGSSVSELLGRDGQ